MAISIYKQAVEVWGTEAQLNMLHEEIGELMVAINHYRRDGRDGTREDILEEIADVEIMLSQLTVMLDGYLEVSNWKKIKLKRLKQRLENST